MITSNFDLYIVIDLDKEKARDIDHHDFEVVQRRLDFTEFKHNYAHLFGYNKPWNHKTHVLWGDDKIYYDDPEFYDKLKILKQKYTE